MNAEPQIVLSGDEMEALKWIGYGRNLLAQTREHMRLNTLLQYKMIEELPGGGRVVAGVVGSLSEINIYIPPEPEPIPVEKPVEEPSRYIVVFIVGERDGTTREPSLTGSKCMFWDIVKEEEVAIPDLVNGGVIVGPADWSTAFDSVVPKTIEWGDSLLKCAQLYKEPWFRYGWSLAYDTNDYDRNWESYCTRCGEWDEDPHGIPCLMYPDGTCNIPRFCYPVWDYDYRYARSHDEYYPSAPNGKHCIGTGRFERDIYHDYYDYYYETGLRRDDVSHVSILIAPGSTELRAGSWRADVSNLSTAVYPGSPISFISEVSIDYDYDVWKSHVYNTTVGCPPQYWPQEKDGVEELTETITVKILGHEYELRTNRQYKTFTYYGYGEEQFWTMDWMTLGNQHSYENPKYYPSSSMNLCGFYEQVMFQIHPMVWTTHSQPWQGHPGEYVSDVKVFAAAEILEQSGKSTNPMIQRHNGFMGAAIENFLTTTWTNLGIMTTKDGLADQFFFTFLYDRFKEVV